jgi:2-polyprenyl-3-methyl-5-hydroxy-6-metoxy-1,4-benzoquinol methylase
VNEELVAQRRYWNNEANAFQRIYDHRKSKFANFLDRLFRKDMYDRFAFTIKNCEPIANRTFLDVGCGNGLYSKELLKRGAAKVVGLDIAEVMVDLCRNATESEQSAGRCSFVQTDLLAYKPETKFDVAIGIGLFDYISEPLPVLKKMREEITDRAIMSFPRFWTWRAPVRKLRLSLRGCIVVFYTKRRIRRLMSEAGFRSCTITKVGKLFCVVAQP